MLTARQKVLAHLKKTRAASAREIARALKMSAPNVRHHLGILTSDGRLEVTSVHQRGGRGRPEKMYSLSQSALGDNLSVLAPLRSYDEAIRVTAWVRANPECTLDSIDAEEARGTPCSVSSRVIAQERATLDKRRVSVIDKRRRIDALLDHRAYP